MKLYELPLEASSLQAELEEAAGELTPDLEQRLDSFLALGADKIDAGACVLRTLEAQAEACAREAQRLKARQGSFQRSADRLRELLGRAVDALGGKVKTSRFTLWIQASPAQTRYLLAEWIDRLSFAGEYPGLVKCAQPELDQEAVAKLLQQPEAVCPEGVETVVIPGSRSLRLR